MGNYYDWYKVIHLIAVISWMAGLLYLPRLFVYHTEVVPLSEEDLRFQKMEYRLLKYIMNPSMIITIIFGLLLAYLYGLESLGVWFHIKFFLVIILAILHMYLGKIRKDFVNNKNNKSSLYFKVLNEIPTVIMIFIVILVIIKPFE